MIYIFDHPPLHTNFPNLKLLAAEHMWVTVQLDDQMLHLLQVSTRGWSIWQKHLAKLKSFPSMVLVQTFRQKFVLQKNFPFFLSFQKIFLMDID